MTGGTAVSLGVDRFEVSPTGQTAKAANVFASLVDVIIHGAAAGTISNDGKHWIDDVQAALCQVWDGTRDCANRGGIDYCDNTNFTLNDMIDALGDVWNETSASNRDAVEDATQAKPVGLDVLGVCAVMGQLYDSDPALPFALAVNGLDCDL